MKLNHFTHSSIHYIPEDHIHCIILQFTKSLSYKKSPIIITNLSKKYLKSKQFFCLILSSEKLIFTKKVNHKKLTFYYSTKNRKLKINSKNATYKQLLTFISCLEFSMEKILNKRVQIYCKR